MTTPRGAIVGRILTGVLIVALALPAWRVDAAGSAPKHPAQRAASADGEEWRTECQAGQELLRQREFARAATVFDGLANRHPEDPWLELYARMSHRRLELQTAPPSAAAPPTPSILRAMSPPPVMIHPVILPPLPEAAAPTAPAPTSPESPSVASAAAPAVPAATPAPQEAAPASPPSPAASEPPTEVTAPVVETTEPYPQHIPLPPPQPLSAPAAGAELPVQAHADIIEFSPELQRVIGRGHVRITQEDMVLTCDRIIVFTQARDALAEGHVRLVTPDNLLTGDTAYYNFTTKKGTILHGGAEFFPWYSRAPHMVKTSAHTILARNGYLTTCDLVPPHYRFESKDAVIYLDDRVVAHNVIFYVGRVPIWYMPRWNHSLRENRLKFSLYPGKVKPWGEFVLGRYRYEINEDAKGTLHWDWRRYFGHGQGVDFKYNTRQFGYGLFRGYYNEEPNTRVKKEDRPKMAGRDRYRILLRHRWDLDDMTNVVLDYQKYSDVNFRREFLFREEFQTETSPETYLLFTRNQPTYTLTSLIKKRVNRFQNVVETLPEIKLDLREQRVGETRLYYNGNVTFDNFHTKRPNSEIDDDTWLLDAFNQLRYAMKLFRFYSVTPRAGLRYTFFNKDRQGGIERTNGDRDILRAVWSSGVDVSTKMYRIVDMRTDRWGLNIRQLRHIITPTVSYNYTHRPTVAAENLLFNGIGRDNNMTLGLENKLQAKQMFDGQLQKVDMVRLLVSAPYTFLKFNSSGAARLGNLSGDLEMRPYPWLRIESDTAYSHQVDRFQTWNMDVSVSGGRQPLIDKPKLLASEIRDESVTDLLEEARPRWTVGVGHRYQREVRSEMTAHIQFQPHPKWWFDLLGRFTYKDVAAGEKRINSAREYQVIMTRDLHDWLLQVTVGEDRDLGGIFLVTLVLKAFPESTVALDDVYHRPKQGSQASAFYAGTPYYRAPQYQAPPQPPAQ